MEVEKLKKLAALTNLAKLTAKALLIIEHIEDEECDKRKRAYSVRPTNRTRNVHGYFKASFLEIKSNDPEKFFIATRMSVHIFNELLNLVKPVIETPSRLKSAFISAECRLSVLLLHLAEGVPMQKLAWSFKLGKETVRSIILDTANAIWTSLFHIYVAEPQQHDYEQIENDFNSIWNFPNCIGAVDGQHIDLKVPPKGGKPGFQSTNCGTIALMAACDAKYRFTLVDVDTYSSENERGIFQNSEFGKRIIHGFGMIPPPKPLPDSDVEVNHYFIADDAFPLALHLMRPYAGQKLRPNNIYFNQRLRKARSTIENAFGVLVARWRILQTTLNMHPDNAKKLVLACVILHNFIMMKSDDSCDYCFDCFVDWEDSNGTLFPGLWRRDIKNKLPKIRACNVLNHYGGGASTIIRNKIRDYIMDH